MPTWLKAPDPNALVSADWRQALSRAGVVEQLRCFDVHLVGTFPLGLDVPGSDLDFVCHAPDQDAFAARIWDLFSQEEGFSMRQWVAREQAIIARFDAFGLPFEIFGSPAPVDAQAGWRHFEVERRLLDLAGTSFHAAVRRARETGLKTEPAFAAVLGLTGDPYAKLLELAGADDAALCRVLRLAGFS